MQAGGLWPAGSLAAFQGLMATQYHVCLSLISLHAREGSEITPRERVQTKASPGKKPEHGFFLLQVKVKTTKMMRFVGQRDRKPQQTPSKNKSSKQEWKHSSSSTQSSLPGIKSSSASSGLPALSEAMALQAAT